MKILHVLDHSIPLQSGYTFRTKAILEQQRKMGWETCHLTSAKHTVAEQLEEEVDDLLFYRSEKVNPWIAKIPIINQLAIIYRLVQRLDEIIPEIKPDILHAHSPALNGVAAIKAGKKYNIPVVYECRAFWEDAAVDHGTTSENSVRYKLTRALESYVFKQANRITTICQGLRTDIINRGNAEEKVTVIPNAVDISKFTFGAEAKKSLRQELGLENNIVLGFIGSFYAYEGLLFLLQAMPEVLKEQPDARLLLVGGGPQEALIKEKTLQLGLQKQVIFTGRVPHNQVQDYYDQVDIFIYPRLQMRLTDLVTPLKPLEAMAQGRLVIASDVGGHKELIKDKQNGMLFKANDKHSLANCVLDLLSHPQNWDAMRQAGKKFVELERNWKTSVKNYAPLYSSLVKRSVVE